MTWGWLAYLILMILAFMVPRWVIKALKISRLESVTLEKCLWPLRLLLMCFLCLVSFRFSSLEPETLQKLKPVILSGLVMSLVWALMHLITLPRKFIIDQQDLKAEDNLKTRKLATQFVVVERVVLFVVILVGICVILMSFEPLRKLGTSLLASAGVVGVVLGFAAQKTIANVFAGIQIAITQPIRLDDVVIMEGEWGWIEEINLTYVVVRIWDKRRLIVPISQCIEKPFQNWTRTSADILGSVFLHVDYSFPVEAIREETTRLLQGREEWDEDCNVVHVTNIGEKTKEVRVLVGCDNSPEAWELRCFLREKLIDFCCEKYPEHLSHLKIRHDNLDWKQELSPVSNPSQV